MHRERERLQKGDNRRACDEHRIGEWIFSPDSHELRGNAGVRRLEHRAARTLELLCHRRGEIVSHEDIVAQVWNGRSISANSVPVVIRDIRRALGDDARQPLHIETVPKRGYRLRAGANQAELEDAPSTGETTRMSRRSPTIVLTIAALALCLLAMGLLGSRIFGSDKTVRLIVTDVENATGSPRYQPLAAATSEVIALNTQGLDGVDVVRSGKASRTGNAVTLSTRLILWEGRPTVMLSAENAAGITIWSSMTSGKEAAIPGEISAAIRDLGKVVR